MTEVTPDKAVTIGGPLPTYTIVILDAEKDALVPAGESGEIAIAGIGLAEGYLNRPELTAQKFIPDFVGIPHNPSKRIYRTGDLGRINADGEVEFQGRIDTQVKVRGYRIELTEIESLLMEFPQVAQAVVSTFEPEPGALELVAYYSLNKGVDEISPEDMCKSLRERLPCYMVPAYFEKLAVVPMTTSNKADRKNLPVPKGGRLTGANDNYVAPRTATETILAEALARALKIDRVSAKDDFFRDLGAHSLLMARFCSDVRQTSGFADISMRDVYMHRTVEDLAAKLDADGVVVAAPVVREEIRVATNFEYYGCGALQALFYAAYGLLALYALKIGIAWTFDAVEHTGALYLRLVAFFAASFVGFTALPIAAKWLVVGRFKAESFPVWSLRYFRFWMVKALIRSAPAAALAGTPLHNLYLRLLGAKIGKGAVILSNAIPVTADLFSVGENTVLSKDSVVVGYRAEANMIHIGEIRVGANAFVGEASVLDIDIAMGDGSELGHASSLQRGQRVPAGKRYHGSPAVETEAEYLKIEKRHCSELRRWTYTALQIVPALLIAPALVAVLFKFGPLLWQMAFGPAGATSFVPSLATVGVLAAFSFALMLIGIGVGLATVIVVPRLLNRFLKVGETYVLFGVHYYVFRLVAGMSNVRLFNLIFGDSSAIVHYLRWIGWELNEVEQTGSNFGTNQKHDNPFLCEIGNGTMVSDGLSMMNASVGASSFRLAHTKIGDRNYLGNNIHYPSDGRTGANVLLGTKVMIPVEGPVREDVGLLGSPCFEIPRAVSRDVELSASIDEATQAARIRAKNWHNIVTVVAWLSSAWLFFLTISITGYATIAAFPAYGVEALAAFAIVMLPLGVLFFAFTERASLGFKPLQPRTVPVLDPYFWSHERHWKFCESPLQRMFKGTPFKNVISRLLGVKVGRKVFDDGAQFLEKTLITVGDHANLNHAVTIQGHSLEEGVFKSDHIAIGSGASLGTAAFIHYGVKMGENVALAPDSFLMKGEEPAPGSIWQGNPAKAVGRRAVAAAGADVTAAAA
jgi:non-ribosomal peptide synthetase-like protein